MVTNSTSFSICSFSQFISVAIMQGLVIKNKILDMRYGRCFSTFKLFLKIFLPMVILAFKTTTSRASGIIKYTFFTPVYVFSASNDLSGVFFENKLFCSAK